MAPKPAIVLMASLFFVIAAGYRDGGPARIEEAEPVKDIDGNVYRTVKIGDQVWMAESLRTTRLRDGQAIAYVPEAAAWSRLRSPGYCDYDNAPANRLPYGALYNWYAVNTEGLAPEGWHVPSDAECKALAESLGGARIAGGKLKEKGTAHWSNPNAGATDETGFAGRGAGARTSDGLFVVLGELNKYWTATKGGHHATDAIYWTLNTSTPELTTSSHQYMDGHSVRCVKDRM